jgi:hypothetical protein
MRSNVYAQDYLEAVIVNVTEHLNALQYPTAEQIK